MTLDEAIVLRDAAQSAYLQALEARAIGYADKSVSRQSVGELRKEYDSWCRIVNDLQRAAIGSNTTPIAAIARWTR